MARVASVLFPGNTFDDRDAPLARSTWLVMAGTVAQGTVRFGSSVLIARYADKEVLGGFNLVLALTVFLVLCWPQACGTAATRFVAMARGERDPDQLAGSAAYTGRVAVLGSLPLAVIGAVYVRLFFDDSLEMAAWTAALVVSLATYNFVRGLRTGSNQFATVAAWDLLSAVVSLALMVLVLALDRTTLVLVPLIVGYLVSALPGWPRLRPTLSPERRKEILRYARWGTVYAVAAGGLLQLATLAASVHATDHELGDLAAAVALATPLSLLAVVVRVSAAPSISRMYAAGDHEGVRSRVDGVTRLLLATVTPLAAVGIIGAPWILEVAFGSQFRTADDMLVLFLVGVAFAGVDPSHVRLSSTYANGVRHSALYNLAGLIVGLVVTFALAPRLGATAAGVGFLVGTALTALVVVIVVWRMDSMKWAGPALQFTVAIGAAVAAFRVFDEDDGVGRALLACALLAACWLTLNRRVLMALWPRT